MFLLEPADLLPRIERLHELCKDHGLPQQEAVATIFKGYAIARGGDPAMGRGLLVEGLAAYDATEAVQWTNWFRGLLAETHQMLGQPHEALDILRKELERTAKRVRGGMMPNCTASAARRTDNAAMTRRRDAASSSPSRSRAARARSCGSCKPRRPARRILRDRGKPDGARTLLGPVYAWFTEGFDTVPLRAAKALLDDLEAARCQS